MSWLRRYVAWAWPVVLLAGLLAVTAVRIGSGWGSGPRPTLGMETDGIVAGRSDDLAAVARRVGLLQEESGETRRRLAALQGAVASKRQQAATLGAMLASDRLTDCPAFLRKQTTVRALQKIIREATDTGMTEAADENRLDTAAAVARERLRRKLEAIRSEWADDITRLDARAAALRKQLHLETSELERLRREVRRQLQGRTPARPAAPAC